MRRIAWIIVLLLMLGPFQASAEPSSETEEVRSFLTELYRARSEFLIRDTPIDTFYLEKVPTSQQALYLEKKRKAYFQAWASKRDIVVHTAEATLKIFRIRPTDSLVKVSLVNRMKVTYSYAQGKGTPADFGMGTRHVLTLKRENGQLRVLKEWYLDPLDIDADEARLHQPPFTSEPETESLKTDTVSQSSKKRRYNRERAVAYANKYAGSAWGAGNDNRYNPKYRDYTGIGGDCTNFVSQVLGDPTEGGGLPMTHTWRYSGGNGSRAWVSTDALKSFLLYSGYGKTIASGTFDQIMRSPSAPNIWSKLQPGDLIAYMYNNDVDHFAVVVDKDERGLPLINCHTTDRYHVPFDLGWENYTHFVLIHIAD
ncbi:amidase domain-containing protein [Paenibacillus oleatilyticus]|uniref:amidase domain-containing protein n=1 Tax=Paenibacillus oleatilyticus TaxID=2594886 RepID=UPI0020A7F76D|nr:amidase domain-containing protein [Paenibacillus oleatilyticus]